MKQTSEGTRTWNATLLLDLVWRERRISRAELARRTGLSRSTVSAIVADLLDSGLVAELGSGDSRGGRRPIILGFQDEARVIAGIDLGATHIGVGITDLRGRVLSWRNGDHPVRDDPSGTLHLIHALLSDALKAAGRDQGDLLGLGVSVPSPYDPSRDELSGQVLPEWRGIRLAEALRQRYGCEVLVDNDANVGAIAEHWWGAGTNTDDLVYVKIATGIGCGFVMNGQPYRGGAGVAGELGHTVIDANGPLCVCGQRGCLTTFMESGALVAWANDTLHEYPGSILSGHKLDLDEIINAAVAADPFAVSVVERAAHFLGMALSNIVNLLNPSKIVLGGGLSRASSALFEPLQAILSERQPWTSESVARVVPSTMGAQGTAIGASTLVLSAALKDPSLFTRKTPASAAS